MNYVSIGFDGLSTAGKSTLVGMLHLRAPYSDVVSENQMDPLRPVTSRLNRLFKEKSYKDAVEEAKTEYAGTVVDGDTYTVAAQITDADEYAVQELKFKDEKCMKQAALAYMFAAGRARVNNRIDRRKNLILDRWVATGCAYQAYDGETESYPWDEILNLNEEMGISLPDVQLLVTCPVDEIPARRSYRQKEGRGTAGQMSAGREDEIYRQFMKMKPRLESMPFLHVVNAGIPCEDRSQQLRQAIPSYLKVESFLRALTATGKVPSSLLSGETLTLPQAEEFFLDGENMEKIRARQIGKV